MRKIIDQYGAYFEPLIIIIALFIAMAAQSQLNLFFLWIALSLVLGIVLWRLGKPESYSLIIKDKIFLAYGLFILWGIISTAYWSEVTVNSVYTNLVFLIGLLSYFIGYTDTTHKAANVQRLLLIMGLGLVTLTCYQFFVLHIPRPMGLLLNWNTHAALLAMIVLPWMLFYALKDKVTTNETIFLSIISLLFTFAMGLTQSRGALMILVIGFVCLMAFILRQRLSYKIALFLLIALVLGYMLSGFFVNETILQRISTVADINSYGATNSGRLTLWLPAWHMYLDKPYLGWGLDAYRALFGEYRAPLTNEWGYYAHNDYLQILLELGPIGLLLLLAFVFFIVKQFYLLFKNQAGVLSPEITTAFVLLTPCIGMLMHTFFTFNLYHFSMQMMLGYYLGRAAGCMRENSIRQEGEADSNKNERFVLIYRVVVFAAILFVSTSGFSTYHLTKAERADEYQVKIDHYLLAGLFFPALHKHEAMSAGYFSLILQNTPDNEKNAEKRRKIAIYALDNIDKAIKKMPRDHSNYIVKAEVLRNIQGDYSEICQQYIKVLQINPALIDARYRYAQYLEENGYSDQAIDLLWAGWGIVNNSVFQIGLDFLNFQLEMNIKYGKPEDTAIIEQIIAQMKLLMKGKKQGQYVFLNIK